MLEKDQNKINTILKSIEDRRVEIVESLHQKRAAIDKENSSKLLMQVILFFVAAGLSYFFVKYMALFVVVFIVVANFILGRKEYILDSKVLNSYHRMAMENLLRALYPNIAYIGNWYGFKKNVGESLLLTGAVSGTDHLSGTTPSGYQFECAEIVETFDGIGRFRGLFLKMENPVFWAKPIVIRPKSRNSVSPDYLAGFKKLIIQDIDSAFEAKYEIFVEDIIEARNLLTLEFLQPLINLSKKCLDIRWSFIGNEICFAGTVKTGLFDALDVHHDVFIPRVLEKFHEDVNLCTSIAEELSQHWQHTSERVKIDFKDKQKMQDLEDPYKHLLEE